MVHGILGIVIEIVEFIVHGSLDREIEFVELGTGVLEVRHDGAGSLVIATMCGATRMNIIEIRLCHSGSVTLPFAQLGCARCSTA